MSFHPGLRAARAGLLIGLGLSLMSGPAHADSLRVGGTGAALGLVRALGEAFTRRHPDHELVVLPSLGSAGGIKAVLAGALDIGLSSRPLSDREAEAGAKGTPFARTPFILVTSLTPPPEDLESRQIAGLFSGDQAAWSNGIRIRLIVRPENDSDTQILKDAFPGMERALSAARSRRGVPVAVTDQDAMRLAEQAPGSLTTASLSAVLAEGRALQVIPIDGVVPTVENLEAGSYRLSKTVLLVMGPNPRPAAQEFVRFALSDEASLILRRLGCIAVSGMADG